jgi:hypothetical protein
LGLGEVKAILNGGPADGQEEEIAMLMAEIVVPEFRVLELCCVLHVYKLARKENDDLAHYDFAWTR